MKLISMTDFVLDIEKNTPKATNFSSFSTIANYEKEMYSKIISYNTFLKQPLKLEMFVPCDDDGNVLEEPIYNGVDDQYYGAQIEQYKKAKEKVLFEGFEGKAQTDSSWVFKYKNNYPIFVSKKGIIEDLLKYNLEITNK